MRTDSVASPNVVVRVGGGDLRRENRGPCDTYMGYRIQFWLIMIPMQQIVKANISSGLNCSEHSPLPSKRYTSHKPRDSVISCAERDLPRSNRLSQLHHKYSSPPRPSAPS